MVLIKNRISRIFFGSLSELLLILGGFSIINNINDEISIWWSLLFILSAVSLKVFIKNDFER